MRQRDEVSVGGGSGGRARLWGRTEHVRIGGGMGSGDFHNGQIGSAGKSPSCLWAESRLRFEIGERALSGSKWARVHSLFPYVKIPPPRPSSRRGTCADACALPLAVGDSWAKRGSASSPFPQTARFLAQDGRWLSARKGRAWSTNRDLDFFVGLNLISSDFPIRKISLIFSQEMIRRAEWTEEVFCCR